MLASIIALRQIVALRSWLSQMETIRRSVYWAAQDLLTSNKEWSSQSHMYSLSGLMFLVQRTSS